MWAGTFLADDLELQCQNPNCRVMIICGGRTEAEAVTNWNTRATAPRNTKRVLWWAIALTVANLALWVAEHGAAR